MSSIRKLAGISSYSELYKHYKDEGYTVQRVLTTEQRKKCDAKAHVFAEHINAAFAFVYVPLGGQHYYLFKKEQDAQIFDAYCNLTPR